MSNYYASCFYRTDFVVIPYLKTSLLEGMSETLSNTPKFEMFQFDHDKPLSYILKLSMF